MFIELPHKIVTMNHLPTIQIQLLLLVDNKPHWMVSLGQQISHCIGMSVKHKKCLPDAQNSISMSPRVIVISKMFYRASCVTPNHQTVRETYCFRQEIIARSKSLIDMSLPFGKSIVLRQDLTSNAHKSYRARNIVVSKT